MKIFIYFLPGSGYRGYDRSNVDSSIDQDLTKSQFSTQKAVSYPEVINKRDFFFLINSPNSITFLNQFILNKSIKRKKRLKGFGNRSIVPQIQYCLTFS